MSAIGYTGELAFDPTKPDGTPRKLLDVSRLHGLGWRPRIPLKDGIGATYTWFKEHAAEARL
jgi:GDP-L-fucose synthase